MKFAISFFDHLAHWKNKQKMASLMLFFQIEHNEVYADKAFACSGEFCLNFFQRDSTICPRTLSEFDCFGNTGFHDVRASPQRILGKENECVSINKKFD